MSQDDTLTDLVGGFSTQLRNRLEQGGSEDVVDKILHAATVATVVGLILWRPDRKAPGVLGLVRAIGEDVWRWRKWFGLP